MRGLFSVIAALAAFGWVVGAVAERTSFYEVFHNANVNCQ